MTTCKTRTIINGDTAAPHLTTIPHYLNYWREKTPDSPALTIVGRKNKPVTQMSYLELFHRVNAMAHFLYDAGLRSGDRIGIFVNRDERLIVTVIAASCLGAVSVPIIVPSQNCLAVLRSYCQLHPMKIVISSGLFDGFNKEAFQSNLTLIPRFLSFETRELKAIIQGGSLTADEDDFLAWLVYRNENEIYYLNHTGGSTGIPKIVEATNNELLVNARACASYLQMNQESSILSCFIGHSHELFFRPITVGGTIVVLPFYPLGQSIATACYQGAVTHLMINPQVATLLAGEPEDLLGKLRGTLKFVEIGGGIISDDICRKLEVATGAFVLPVYGATELSGVALARPLAHEAPYNFLKPLPGYLAEIQDVHGVADSGELVISGPAVASGYTGSPAEATRLQGKKFFTKDLALCANVGIKILGRMDSSIKVLGKLQPVEPIELEIKRLLRNKLLSVQVLPVAPRKNEWLPTLFGARIVAILKLSPDLEQDPNRHELIRRALRKTALPAVMQVPSCFIVAGGDDELKVDGGKLLRPVARSRFPFTVADWSPADRERLIRVGAGLPQWFRLFSRMLDEKKAVARPLETFMRTCMQLLKSSNKPSSESES